MLQGKAAGVQVVATNGKPVLVLMFASVELVQ